MGRRDASREGDWSMGLKRWLCHVSLCLIPLHGLAAAPRITASQDFALALRSDGTVAAWGINDVGQLGNGQASIRVSPAMVTGIGQVRAVAAGQQFTLALRSDGTLWSWGANDFGQLGDGTIRDKTRPVRVSGIGGTVTSIAAGHDHSLALTSDGRVWAWGDGSDGELGTGDTEKRTSAVPIAGLPQAKAIAAAGYHSLALANDGSVWAWGGNGYGQLGIGSTAVALTPVRVNALSNIVAISARALHNLALDTSGQVWSWGYGGFGALGHGGYENSSVPSVVPGLPPIRGVYVGGDSSLALAGDGSLWVWGYQKHGLLGVSQSAIYVLLPARATELTGFTSITMAQSSYALARDADGALRSWGQNDQGQLGLGDTSDHALPALVTGIPQVSQFAAGYSHSVAVASDGSVWSWGSNGRGELGDAAVASSSIPVNVPGLANIAAVAPGTFHALALAADGSVWAWGRNNVGQLADSTRRDARTPQQVTNLRAVIAIAAGYDYSLALDGDGAIWSWGLDRIEQASSNSANGYASVRNTLHGATAISAGASHALVLGAGGSVWSWGRNDYGQLGDGTRTERATPARVPDLPEIAAISAGNFHSLALDSGGRVWAWGRNVDGRLGDGTTSDRLVPVRLAGISEVIAVSAGGSNSCAITQDGRLWAWGDNEFGQLGYPAASNYSPVPGVIAGIAGFQNVSCGTNFAAAMRTDGSVWAWGGNFFGQVGDGTFAARDQPALAVNEMASGPLDLIPEIANSIPPDRIPPYFARATRAGDLDAISLSVDIRGTGPSGAVAQGEVPGRFAAGYNLYVAAGVPMSGVTQYFQLDSGNNWSALAWPMTEYLRGVALNSQDDVIEVRILRDTDVSQLAGASMLVGYGLDPEEMLKNNRYRTIFTVPRR